MSKQEGSGEHKATDAATAKPADSTAKAGATHGATHGSAASSKASTKSTAGVGSKAGCHGFNCKEKDVRYNFCEEHFRQFKFGLITKTGEPVQDYDRKVEHYQKWLACRKVA